MYYEEENLKHYIYLKQNRLFVWQRNIIKTKIEVIL